MKTNPVTTSSSFVNAVSELNDGDQNAFLAAIMQYQLFGNVVELNYHLKALFAAFKTQIDEYNEKPSRGRKSKNQICANNSANIENKPSKKSSVREKSADKNVKTQNQPSSDSSELSKKENNNPAKPTLDEVKAFIAEQSCSINLSAEDFYSWASAHEWKQGAVSFIKTWRDAYLRKNAKTTSSNEVM